jgi:hypothetical protein
VTAVKKLENRELPTNEALVATKGAEQKALVATNTKGCSNHKRRGAKSFGCNK